MSMLSVSPQKDDVGQCPRSDAAASGGIVCAMVPYWGDGNPYQDQLAKSLTSQGTQVHMFESLKAALRYIRSAKVKVKILHLHWLPVFAFSLMMFLRLVMFYCRLALVRALGIKIVWTVHNLRPHESRWPKGDWLIGKLVAALSSAIIVHTDAGAAQVGSMFGEKIKDKIFVIPHGNYIGFYQDRVDRATSRRKLEIPESKTVIVSLGTIRPYKGILSLIQSFKELERERQDICLLIAGKLGADALRGAIETEIAGHENIYFRPGFVLPEDVQLYMRGADACVFPYEDILTTGALILAMSFGRACIAPALGDVTEVLGAEGGYVYDPKEPSGLLNALRQATESRAKLEQMGQYNRRRAVAWDWSHVAQRTLETYRRALS